MLGLAFVAVRNFADDLLLVQVFVFALQAYSSPAPMSFPHARTSLEVTHPKASPSSPSLPSEGRDEEGGGGMSRDALVLLPEGLPLLPLDFCPPRGVEVSLVWSLASVSSALSGAVEGGVASSQQMPPAHAASTVASPCSSHLLRRGESGESSVVSSRSRSSRVSRSSGRGTRKVRRARSRSDSSRDRSRRSRSCRSRGRERRRRGSSRLLSSRERSRRDRSRSSDRSRSRRVRSRSRSDQSRSEDRD